MPEEIKSFRIVGDASILHGSGKRGRRQTRRTEQKGGAGLSQAYADAHAAQESTVVKPQRGGDIPPGPAIPLSTSNATRLITNAKASPAIVTPPPQAQSGGKIVLAPPKAKPTKILLAPPKAKPTMRSKGTRKIRVGLSGMRRRMTRAKKIHHDSTEQSVEYIRNALLQAKLIKADSKVPEKLMRDMYKDYQLLKDRAL